MKVRWICVLGVLLLPYRLVSQVELSLSPSSLRIAYPPSLRSPDTTLLTNILRVYVGETLPSPQSAIPPMLGQVSFLVDSLSFQPFLSFRPGQLYTGIFRERDTFHFSLPSIQDSPSPQVVSIYPSGESIPANQLKLYLYFSQPMRTGFAYSHIRVRDAQGKVLDQPFVPLQPELWNEGHTRLTLWLDPGRIKRGLASHEAFGEVLTPGQTLSITVSQAWEDRAGQALSSDFTKLYRVGEYDRISPLPQEWILSPPPASSQAPLRVDFQESLDYALLLHTFHILDGTGKKVEGEFHMYPEEKGWEFVPTEQWIPGSYTLQVESILEDLAGNNLNRLFDRDLSKDGVQKEEAYKTIPFRIDSVDP